MCGGQILLSRTFPTISPLTGQEVLVGSNTRFPLTFSIKLIMSAGITVACWIKSFSFRRESLSFSRDSLTFSRDSLRLKWHKGRGLTRVAAPGGGTPHIKGVGILVGNFELNP